MTYDKFILLGILNFVLISASSARSAVNSEIIVSNQKTFARKVTG